MGDERGNAGEASSWRVARAGSGASVFAGSKAPGGQRDKSTEMETILENGHKRAGQGHAHAQSGSEIRADPDHAQMRSGRKIPQIQIQIAQINRPESG